MLDLFTTNKNTFKSQQGPAVPASNCAYALYILRLHLPELEFLAYQYDWASMIMVLYDLVFPSYILWICLIVSSISYITLYNITNITYIIYIYYTVLTMVILYRVLEVGAEHLWVTDEETARPMAAKPNRMENVVKPVKPVKPKQVQNNGLCVRTRQWYGQGKGNGGNSPATVKEALGYFEYCDLVHVRWSLL